MSQRLLRLSVITLIFLLNACFGGGNYAPVVERQGRAKVVPKTHIVYHGETLYSIAWRYNKDVRELADTNNIRPPYTIYPGQKLYLKSVPHKPSGTSRRTAGNTVSTTASGSERAAGNSAVSRSNGSVSGNVTWDRNRYPFRWKWPATGHLLTRYSSGSVVHKGIDIQGKLGEPVVAANSGKVVYAGSGLVGYGKLLIIKHNEHYLSAYGHNRRLLVREGEMVRVGQKIAEFGDTGTNKVKLHFEIRRDGKPINPLSLLPRG